MPFSCCACVLLLLFWLRRVVQWPVHVVVSFSSRSTPLSELQVSKAPTVRPRSAYLISTTRKVMISWSRGYRAEGHFCPHI